jgi:hypothetical protein
MLTLKGMKEFTPILIQDARNVEKHTSGIGAKEITNRRIID